MKGWRIVGLGMMAVCMMQFTAWAESRSSDAGFVETVLDQAKNDFIARVSVSEIVKSDFERQVSKPYATWAMMTLQNKNVDSAVKFIILNNLYSANDARDISQLLKIESDILAARFRRDLQVNITADDILKGGKIPPEIPPIGHGRGTMATSAPAPGFGRATDCMNQKMADAGFAGGIPGGGVTDPVASAGMFGESGGMGQQGPIGKQTPGKPGLGATTSSAAGLCGAVDWGKMNKGGTIGKEGDSWNGSYYNPATNTSITITGKETADGKIKANVKIKYEDPSTGQANYKNEKQTIPVNPKGDTTVTTTDPKAGTVKIQMKNTEDASQTNTPDDGSTPPTATATDNPIAEDGGGISAEQACINAYNDCTTPEEKEANKAHEDCEKNKAAIRAKLGPVALPSPDGIAVGNCGKNAYAGLDQTKMKDYGLLDPNPIGSNEPVQPGKVDCSTADPLGKPKPGCGPGSGGGIPGGPGEGGGGPAMMPTTTGATTAMPSLWQKLKMGFGRAGGQVKP